MISEKHTAFIFHGSYGYPEENWFPWLKNELEKLGLQVFIPRFPIPKDEKTGHHDINTWMSVFAEYRKYLNEKTILIPHSRGGIFTYHILNNLTFPVRAVFFVAPWIRSFYDKKWIEPDSFTKKMLDWRKIKQGSQYFEVYQSTNDVIPVSEGREIADNLGGKLILVKNAGHFNAKAGYTQFPLLLENIKKQIFVI